MAVTTADKVLTKAASRADEVVHSRGCVHGKREGGGDGVNVTAATMVDKVMAEAVSTSWPRPQQIRS